MWIRVAIGVVLLVVGGVWIGQGVGWIEGSFMTGEAVWAVIGRGRGGRRPLADQERDACPSAGLRRSLPRMPVRQGGQSSFTASRGSGGMRNPKFSNAAPRLSMNRPASSGARYVAKNSRIRGQSSARRASATRLANG